MSVSLFTAAEPTEAAKADYIVRLAIESDDAIGLGAPPEGGMNV